MGITGDLSAYEERYGAGSSIRLSGRMLTVSGEDGTPVKIHSSTGERVFYGTLENDSLKVDLSRLPRGAYMVRTPALRTKVVLR